MEYDISRGGSASFKMYSLLGEEVVALTDKHHEPGSYEAVFDASHLSSGFYIYRLHTWEGSLTRRMLFVK